MRPTTLRLILLLWICLPVHASAASKQPASAPQNVKVEQLERRVIDLEQARKDDAKEFQGFFDKIQDKIDVRLEKLENNVKEDVKQETGREKEFVEIANKNIGLGINIISIFISIIILIGGFLIFKSHYDFKKVKLET
jgi:TolA-binding protein